MNGARGFGAGRHQKARPLPGVAVCVAFPLVVLDEEFSIDLANRAFRFGHKTRSMPTRYHILALVRLQEVGSKLEAHMKVKEASDAGKCELMALDTM